MGWVSLSMPQAVILGFLATCTVIVLISTAVIWRWPKRYRAVLFAHFTLLWAANLMLAIVMRHAWIASGQWEEHQLQFSVLIGFPGAALTIIWLAWVVYSFGGNERQEKTTQTS
jgi:hypothetical protein